MFSKHVLEWKEWLGKLALGFIAGVFAKGGGHTSQFFPCLSTAFLEQNWDWPTYAFWALPWEDPNSQRKVGGSREAAGAMVGRLSSCSPRALPTLVWLPAALQSALASRFMYPLENMYNFLTNLGLVFFQTPGAGNDKTLPRSLLSELNYVFALMLFIFGLLIYFLSLEEIFTKQR